LFTQCACTPRLPGGELRIGERVEVMHGAHEAGDQPALLQRGERIGAEPVLRVQHVEAGLFEARCEVVDEGGDTAAGHVDHVDRGRCDRHRLETAIDAAEQTLPVGGRREHGHVVALRMQRLRQLDRMHDAAARIDRVRQQTDAQSLRHRGSPAVRG
jgi:hypothetical protein